jgi:hypothetical protein
VIVHAREEGRSVQRLGEKVIRASSQSPHNILPIRARGNEQHRHRVRGVPLSNVAQEIKPIHIRHRDIEQNQRGHLFIDKIDTLRSAPTLNRVVPTGRENGHRHPSTDRTVVND